MIRPALLRAGMAALFATGLAAPLLAQSSPVLPTMPMPPSFSDPKPAEAAKPGARKPAAERAKRTETEPGQAAAPRAKRSEAAPARTGNAASSYDRPTRYVPEEFDRGGGGDGSRAKPFMSESGRPGMGMRF